MVESGNVAWDVVQVSQGTIIALNRNGGDYFEKLDYDLIDTRDVDPVFRSTYGHDILTYGEVMAYRTDVFGGKVPKGWADFWDTKKFPGARTMASGNGSNSPELEFALMAMGKPKDQVYPIDIGAAYDKLAQLKPSVEKWWDTGAQPVQMLSDKEVVLATVWNGRVPAIQAAGAPVEISWDQGLLKRDCYAIPKGAKNRENAMKFIAFMTMPIPQARLSTLIPYGGVNNKAAEYIPAEALAKLPIAPDIKPLLVPYDYVWWGENRAKIIDQWNHWVLD
jgi:putative spermidine/putrescine transport system substrate-binding protein